MPPKSLAAKERARTRARSQTAKRQAKRRAAGKCIGCGVQLDDPAAARCEDCRRYQREWRSAFSRKRKAAGTCTRCGVKVRGDGYRCFSCAVKNADGERGRRAEKKQAAEAATAPATAFTVALLQQLDRINGPSPLMWGGDRRRGKA